MEITSMSAIDYLRLLKNSQIGIGKYAQKWLDEAIEALEQKSDWVPVGEGLPEEGEIVIASTAYGVYPEARYSEKYGWEWAYESGADYWVQLDLVLAWMSLPTKYEPQESEGEE